MQESRDQLYHNNQGLLQSSTFIDSECKKKHIAIANHDGIVNPIKVGTEVNLSDFFTKGTAWKTHHFLTGVFFGWWIVGDGVSMVEIKL